MATHRPNMFTRVVTVIFWGSVIGLGALLSLRLLPKLGWSIPLQSFVVQSGSMEPSIMTGDVILVAPATSFHLNQVITFADEENRVITHRIIEQTGEGSALTFTTKGDANRSIDIAFVQPVAILGYVVLTIPKIGYLVAWLRTPLGVIALVVIPGTIIIYDELTNLARSDKKNRR